MLANEMLVDNEMFDRFDHQWNYFGKIVHSLVLQSYSVVRHTLSLEQILIEQIIINIFFEKMLLMPYNWENMVTLLLKISVLN